MFKISSNDTFIWTKRLDYWLGYATGIKKTTDGFLSIGYGNYYGVVTGLYGGYHYLIKCTADGEMPGCESYENSVGLRELPFKYLHPATVVIDSNNFHSESITPTPKTGHFGEGGGCNKISDCNSIQIIGTSNHCSTLPAIFKGRRNLDCKLPVSFSVSPSTGVNIQTLNDSTGTITFSTDGTYLVRSILTTNCGDYYDSILVKVQRPASLYLGPDTLLCHNSSIKLAAQQGYKRYLWNNSSADSILVINTPGLYHVKAEDHCGGFFYDTVKVKAAPAFAFTAGIDQSICNGEKLALSATAEFTNYQWYPNYNISSSNTANTVVNPNTDTTYIVIAEKWPGCIVRDTISITVKSIPLINLGNDTSFCAHDSIILFAGNDFSEYSWNTGSTTSSVIIKSAGTYSVIAKATNRCASKDTIIDTNVYPLPKPDLGDDFNLCTNEERRLEAGNFKSYEWHDESTDPYFTVNDTGKYWVKVTDNNNCSSRDTVDVKALWQPPANFLKNADSICENDKLQLQPQANFVNYKWSTGSNEHMITVDRAGLYTLAVVDVNGCKGSDTIDIVQKDCILNVYIPTAFTANDDGINDRFGAKVFGNVLSFRLQVFNRLGQLVFSTTDPGKAWDGKVGGIAVDPGTFVYDCAFHIEGSKPRAVRGTVVLIR
jgi:gliding motility-associated-like protein